MWTKVKSIFKAACWMLGFLANLFGVYDFGDRSGWWHLDPIGPMSPELSHKLWMITAGLAGPWALVMGGWIGVWLAARLSGEYSRVNARVHSIVRVAFFFAMLHMAEVDYVDIFPNFLSGGGILKLALIYGALGTAFGALHLIGDLVAKWLGERRASAW